MNRKLIRPTLAEVKNREVAPPDLRESRSESRGDNPRPSGGGGGGFAPRTGAPHSRPAPSGGDRPGGARDAAASGRKRIPPSETNAEIFYYKKQMDAHTLMVIVLLDGEEVEGTIEWYDRSALKVNRHGEPNILLLKHNIKYMFKAEDRDGGDGDDSDDGDAD